jgi:hypothetical protein
MNMDIQPAKRLSPKLEMQVIDELSKLADTIQPELEKLASSPNPTPVIQRLVDQFRDQLSVLSTVSLDGLKRNLIRRGVLPSLVSVFIAACSGPVDVPNQPTIENSPIAPQPTEIQPTNPAVSEPTEIKPTNPIPSDMEVPVPIPSQHPAESEKSELEQQVRNLIKSHFESLTVVEQVSYTPNELDNNKPKELFLQLRHTSKLSKEVIDTLRDVNISDSVAQNLSKEISIRQQEITAAEKEILDAAKIWKSKEIPFNLRLEGGGRYYTVYVSFPTNNPTQLIQQLDQSLTTDN